MSRKAGCCRVLHLGEENARFLLLAVVLVLYMLFGAAIFQFLEAEEEQRSQQSFWTKYQSFRDKYNGTVGIDDLETLLYAYGNASVSGIIHKRPRWDFSGSIYFVGTVISTIGFGMTTPKTMAGKIMVITYGFLGCSGGILFFNLFLERIITLLASLLRSFHDREMIRKGLSDGRRNSQLSSDGSVDTWKPSVYWVMLCLSFATTVLAVSASALYSTMEGWTYIDAVYFCFGSFATIGFGDLVPSQRLDYTNAVWYRGANFFILVCGCCCIYSLFNVLSIIIKQFLNWIIKKLDCYCPCMSQAKVTVHPLVITKHKEIFGPSRLYKKRHQISRMSSNAYWEVERQNSEEMISVCNLLKPSNVSLAVMQKELYESAQKRSPSPLPSSEESDDTFKPGNVGPLAIISMKLQDDMM